MKKNYFLTLMIMFLSWGAFSQLTAPFTEHFGGTILPSTWTSSATTGGPWRVGSVTSIRGNSPIVIDDHSGIPGSTITWMDFSSTDIDVILESDTIDVSALTIPELNFYVNSNSTAVITPYNVIYIEAYNGASWALVDSVRENHLGIWTEKFYNMSSFVFSSNKLLIRFRTGLGGGSFPGGIGSDFNHDIALDDIGVIEFSPCRPVININSRNVLATSTTVGWTTATGGDTAWIVEYGVSGFTPGTGTTVQVSIDSADLTGLLPATIYDFYITAICAGDTTIGVGPNSFITGCTSGLAGNYTIDVANPSSGTNFNSFDDFFSTALNCGLDAATVVDVVAGSGPYIVSADVSSIPRSSAINTLTFNGNGNVINHGGGTYFLALRGVKHLTINDFNFINETPNTPAFGIMMREGCDSITIKNNTIDMGTGYTSFSSCGVCASNSLTSAVSAGNNADNITIDSNTIIGSTYGVAFRGTSTTIKNTGHKVTNNIFRDIYSYGVYNYGSDNFIAKNNDVSRPSRAIVTTFYGIYSFYSVNDSILNNKIHDGGVAGYTSYPIFFGNSTNTALQHSVIANNAIYNNLTTSGTQYAIYLNSTQSFVDVHHNTVQIDVNGGASTIRAIYATSTPNNLDVSNNLVSVNGNGTGSKHCYYSNSSATFTGNNNLFYMGATAGTNNNSYFGTNQATIADWSTATSTTGNSEVNPSIIVGSYIPLAGPADNGGTPLGYLINDIDGAVRSTTTPDYGAVEFVGLPGDLTLTDTWLNEASLCFGASDTAYATVKNDFGTTVDFSVNNLVVNWNIAGPVPSTGTITLVAGMLPVGSDTTFYVTTVDMTQPGVYTVSADIATNAVNASNLNDTLLDHSTFDKAAMIEVDPRSDTVIVTISDSIKISTQSPFYPSGAFFISEICQFAGSGTGVPIGGRPSWLSSDDYIEITGVPNSDLAGVTLEQWTTSSLTNSFTFPIGTVLSPNGTAIVSTQGGIASPADFYYVAFNNSTGSGTSTGRLLKDPSGMIMDAAGYGTTYTFPAAAGVTAADWSGNQGSSSGSWGIRLEGADVNSPTNWVFSSGSPQDPNTVNTGVTVPAPPSVAGLQWTDITNSLALDTTPEIYAKGWTINGLYQYEATFATPCGTFSDTSDILVLLQTIDTVPFTVCDTFTTPLGGVSHTASGYYSDTIMGTAIVYDSVIHVYDVTVNTMTFETIVVAICDSFQVPSGISYDTTGIYMDTIPNALGCDSVITIDLTITTTTFIEDTVFACDSNDFRGTIITVAGTYYDTLSSGSCDSIFIRTLTFGNATWETITQFVCDSFVSPTGKVWNVDGTFMDTITNASGCDSNMVFNLTFGYISYANFTVTTCDMFVSPSGKVWTVTGNYLDTIVNASGCDSALTYALTINNSVSRTDNIALCAGIPHRVGPTLYTVAGTYTDVFQTSLGCDSTIITNLTYFAPSVATINYNFCIGDSVQILGIWYHSATVIKDTVVGGSSNGCDSITTHNITTRTVNPALNLGDDVASCLDGGVTIFASNAYDTYNWSSGGTTNVLSVTGAMSGSGSTDHILTVTQASSGCTATDTVNVTFQSCVGLNEVDADLNVNLYPNPASNFVTIEVFDKYNTGDLRLEIMNSLGQVISSRTITNSNEKVIMDVNNFSKGLYFVRISSDKVYMTKKLLIQK